MKRNKLTELHNYGYEAAWLQTDPNWVVLFSDDDNEYSENDQVEHKFAVHFKAVDMYDATGEKEFEEFPIVVEATLVAANPHASFLDGEPDTFEGRIEAAMNYMGGVPITHILQSTVVGAEGQGQDWDAIVKAFNPKEAMLKRETHRHGTWAAQNGNKPFEYLRFANIEAAERFVKMLAQRSAILGIMVGFILDQPINLIGDSGWSMIEHMIKGSEEYRKAKA